jgi:hypothetical protein
VSVMSSSCSSFPNRSRHLNCQIGISSFSSFRLLSCSQSIPIQNRKRNLMASCANCNTFIVFGGKRSNNQVFCSGRCLQAGLAADAASLIDPDVLRQEVEAVFRGPCPKCSKQNGPVDIRKSHEVFSALVFTRWSTKVMVGCKSCGTKKQVGAMLFSGFAGWWGFPWGLVMTPIQVVRNATEIFSKNSNSPSPELERAIRLQMGAQYSALVPHVTGK